MRLWPLVLGAPVCVAWSFLFTVFPWPAVIVLPMLIAWYDHRRRTDSDDAFMFFVVPDRRSGRLIVANTRPLCGLSMREDSARSFHPRGPRNTVWRG